MDHFHRRPALAGLLPAALGAALAAVSGPAFAAAPDHERDQLVGESTYAAGDLCAVEVRESVTYRYHSTVFGDGSSLEHADVVFTYVNTATGASATDTGRFTTARREGRLVVVGLGVNLRGLDGAPLGVQAGRTVLDAETFELISRTGKVLGDYGSLVCSALGSSPAG